MHFKQDVVSIKGAINVEEYKNIVIHPIVPRYNTVNIVWHLKKITDCQLSNPCLRNSQSISLHPF